MIRVVLVEEVPLEEHYVVMGHYWEDSAQLMSALN